jgi:hypothetical protein
MFGVNRFIKHGLAYPRNISSAQIFRGPRALAYFTELKSGWIYVNLCGATGLFTVVVVSKVSDLNVIPTLSRQHRVMQRCLAVRAGPVARKHTIALLNTEPLETIICGERTRDRSAPGISPTKF